MSRRTPVLLVDEPDRAGRTTAALVASLTGRLTALSLVSGADVIGALAAGVAALGRQAGETAEGRVLREGLAHGRPATNAAMIWQQLGIDRWLATMPASRVLDQLRNDVALLLVDDLAETFELPPLVAEPTGTERPETPERIDPVDLIVGMWVLAKDTVDLVQALSDSSGLAESTVVPGRPATNAALIWQQLGIDRWLATMPASRVLDQLRNDVALLLVDDLAETFDLPPLIPEPVGADRPAAPERIDPLDLVVGMWVLAKDTVGLVEALADTAGLPEDTVVPGRPATARVDGGVLR